MFSHIVVGSNDIARSKKFCDAVFTSIEDPPGVRANGAYLAYLRDPDGNKLVAVARPAG